MMRWGKCILGEHAAMFRFTTCCSLQLTEYMCKISSQGGGVDVFESECTLGTRPRLTVNSGPFSNQSK